LRRIATRDDPVTGVSEFPLLNETPVRREPRPARSGGGLPVIRYAEVFESLRDRADNAAARPTVFLATLGPVAAHSATAGFAANLWNSGGIAAVNPGPLDGAGAAATAFIASRASIACICPPPDMSTADIAAVVTALRSAGAQTVWLTTVDPQPPTEESTVDGWLYAGCDAVAVLTRTLATLEVP
jgi:methylmalonyl-CoA mutase